MSEKILRLENITMQFGGVIAVNNMNLEVGEGEIVSLIGPNGAGKTTAFNVITGVYQPTNGCVWFDGKKIIENHPRGKMKKLYQGQNNGKYTQVLAPTPDKITQLGMARTFQNIRLWKEQSVLDNVRIAMHCRRSSNLFSATFRLNAKEEAEQTREAMELLELLGLAHVKDELSTSLPYGQQRHLEIARALATHPKLLLLDEPAAGMNPSETVELMENILKIRDTFQIAIMLIEHDMKLVSGICEYLYVLNFGRLLAEGTPKEVLSNPEVVKAYLGE